MMVLSLAGCDDGEQTAGGGTIAADIENDMSGTGRMCIE